MKKTAFALALAALGLTQANAAVISFEAPLNLETTEIKQTLLLGNRSLSGVLSPPAPTRNNPSHFHEGGVGSDQGDSDQQQVAAP